MAPPAEEARWRALAEQAAGGAFDALRDTSDDGLVIEPLYVRNASDGPRPWRSAAAWAVSPRIDHPDPVAANALALLDLEGGADALTLVTAGSPYARGFGLVASSSSLAATLEHIELDLIAIRVDAGRDAVVAISALVDLVSRRRLASAGLVIDLGYDPIGDAARSGQASEQDELGLVLELSRRSGLTGRPLLADGRPYHEAGASEGQELAAVLATAVAYLRRLEAIGLDLEAARDAVAVLLVADSDVLLGLAKMRAMRHLWARIETASDLDPKPLRLHAETSWRVMTRRDPWTNTLRATAATAAAGLGGADVITVLPMTLPLGLPDEHARRLARNVGRVLLDEAHLAEVEDPAGGSGAFDTLTAGLCEHAWGLFQAIERQGGVEAVLRTGTLQAQIANSATRRAVEIATLTHRIVGTSRFPGLVSSEPPVLDVQPRATPIAGADALPSRRDAEPFEALREHADAETRKSVRPAVFLATLGAPAAFGASATGAANAFAAGGISAIAQTEELEPAAIVERFAASGTSVVCLCGDDAQYTEAGEAIIAALRSAGARWVLMAGTEGSWLGKGVDALVHDGVDLLSVLDQTLEQIVGSAR